MLKINLKHRELTNEAKAILFKYIFEGADWKATHNELIGIGIFLTEENELIDY